MENHGPLISVIGLCQRHVLRRAVKPVPCKGHFFYADLNRPLSDLCLSRPFSRRSLGGSRGQSRRSSQDTRCLPGGVSERRQAEAAWRGRKVDNPGPWKETLENVNRGLLGRRISRILGSRWVSQSPPLEDNLPVKTVISPRQADAIRSETSRKAETGGDLVLVRTPRKADLEEGATINPPPAKVEHEISELKKMISSERSKLSERSGRPRSSEWNRTRNSELTNVVPAATGSLGSLKLTASEKTGTIEPPKESSYYSILEKTVDGKVDTILSQSSSLLAPTSNYVDLSNLSARSSDDTRKSGSDPGEEPSKHKSNLMESSSGKTLGLSQEKTAFGLSKSAEEVRCEGTGEKKKEEGEEGRERRRSLLAKYVGLRVDKAALERVRRGRADSALYREYRRVQRKRTIRDIYEEFFPREEGPRVRIPSGPLAERLELRARIAEAKRREQMLREVFGQRQAFLTAGKRTETGKYRPLAGERDSRVDGRVNTATALDIKGPLKYLIDLKARLQENRTSTE